MQKAVELPIKRREKAPAGAGAYSLIYILFIWDGAKRKGRGRKPAARYIPSGFDMSLRAENGGEGVGSPMTGIGMTGLCHPRFFGMRTVTTTASGDSSRETLASTPPERRSSTPRETVL